MRNLIFTLLFLGAQAFADVGSSTLSDISTGGSSGGGSGDVVGPSSSTDGHAVLFDGPTGKLIKVATGTGYAYVTSGVFSVKSGTSAQYLRADGTVSTLDTSAVAEGSNLYFTNARAIASTLTGYTSGAGTVASSDTVLQAIQKLNGNVAARGDFSGPASSTDNAIVAFDGPGGKTGKNTTVTVGTNQIQVYPHATSDTAVKGSAGTMTLRVGGTDAWYIDYSGAPQLRPAGSSYPVLKANANGNVDRGIWLLTGNLGTITHANYYSGQIGYSGSGPYTPTISAWKSTASQSLVMGYASGDDFPTVSDGTIKVKTGTNLNLTADSTIVTGPLSTITLTGSAEPSLYGSNNMSFGVSSTEFIRFFNAAGGLVQVRNNLSNQNVAGDGNVGMFGAYNTTSDPLVLPFKYGWIGEKFMIGATTGSGATYIPNTKLDLRQYSAAASHMHFTNDTTGHGTGDGTKVGIDGAGNFEVVNQESGGLITLDAARVVIKNSVTPASASATCVTGTQAWDSSYVYVCVATDTWKRAALSTW